MPEPEDPNPREPPAWPEPDRPAHPDAPSAPQHRPPGPVGTVVSWAAIAFIVLLAVVQPLLPSEQSAASAEGPDPVEEIMARIQGRVMVGLADFLGQYGQVYAQAQATLDLGSVAQRLRFVVLAAEFVGPQQARERLDVLDEAIRIRREQTADSERPFEVSGPIENARTILGRLYPETLTDAEGPGTVDLAAMTDVDRAELVDVLGWYGTLALGSRFGGDADLRDEAIAPARRATAIFYLMIGAGMLVGFGGFIGLVTMIVLASTRRLSQRLETTTTAPGLYVQTFALWIFLFTFGQVLVALLPLPMAGQLPAVAALFFASLIALGWPVFRGVPWSRVRADIGWTSGRGAVAEIGSGILGYAMMLPILGVGLLLTLLLLFIDGAMATPVPELDPQTGPAHPIIAEIGSGNMLVIGVVLLIAACAAPIVEETMFRGVLHRHLRDVSRRLGVVTSIALSTLINTFVFAIIHPQGWVAVPALMSLAVAFTLAREWRGSVIASMVMHGVSNGVILTTVCLLAAP